jgi:GNAT superfamily N-acetyltransferase
VIAAIDIEEVVVSRDNSADPHVREIARDASHWGFDGRPYMWESIGADPSSVEIIVVAYLDQVPAGWAWGKRQLAEITPDARYSGIERLEEGTAGTWFLQYFGVRPDLRRKGVGRRLFDHVEQVGAANGADGVSVIVPLPDEPGPRPTEPWPYGIGYPGRYDTVPFLEGLGYSVRGSATHLFSLGYPVTNLLMIKEFA